MEPLVGIWYGDVGEEIYEEGCLPRYDNVPGNRRDEEQEVRRERKSMS